MIGHQAIVSWRIRGLPVAALDVLVTKGIPSAFVTACGLYETPKGWKGDLWIDPAEAIESLDFRFAAGIGIVVHAEDDDAGMRAFDRLSEFQPRFLALITPKRMLRFTKGEVTECAL